MTHEEHEEPVGTLAEEAERLLAALGDWAGDHRVPGAGHPVTRPDVERDDAAAQEQHPAADGPCAYCPICRSVHLVRTASPEVREQLAVAASALLQAGTALLASLGARQQRADGARPRAAPVERIDLDEEPPPGDPGHGADDDGWEA